MMLPLRLGCIPSLPRPNQPGEEQRFPTNPYMGVSQIRCTIYWGLYNTDYSILRSILGSHYFGKLPHVLESNSVKGGYIGDCYDKGYLAGCYEFRLLLRSIPFVTSFSM